jgi:hypothetical protein
MLVLVIPELNLSKLVQDRPKTFADLQDPVLAA